MRHHPILRLLDLLRPTRRRNSAARWEISPDCLISLTESHPKFSGRDALTTDPGTDEDLWRYFASQEAARVEWLFSSPADVRAASNLEAIRSPIEIISPTPATAPPNRIASWLASLVVWQDDLWLLAVDQAIEEIAEPHRWN